ncbi:MAG: SusD/RagB family nutrient-binding outer membrane lipoprotein [Saprospiraceae bacterium]|nr:SusD/RagB family nutrient-binding outer membrane lipoprotein [Saprospiraceae bacterium]
MADIGVSQEAAQAYLDAAYPSLTAATLTKDLVMKEKYVAMFLHPEAWVDARRFDYQYKDFTLPANAELNEFIRRVQYPTVEITRNRQNVPIINSLAERLFWDK